MYMGSRVRLKYHFCDQSFWNTRMSLIMNDTFMALFWIQREKERGGGDPDNPFGDDDDADKMEAIAKAFEEKYVG